MIRKLWAALLAWLESVLMMSVLMMDEPDEPDVTPPAEDDPIVHTMDAGQDAAVTKGPQFRNGTRLL